MGAIVQRINYATGSVLTGDDIAHALVAYAKALAQKGTSDMVAFPVLLDTGDVDIAEVIVGPSSQIMNVPEPSDRDDVTDDDVVREIVRRTDALGLSRPQPEAPRVEEDEDYVL
jgi:hypothetical protein